MGAEKALEQGLIKVAHYEWVEKAVNKYKLKTQAHEHHDDCRGIWIKGVPGVGKSYIAHHAFGEVYKKA